MFLHKVIRSIEVFGFLMILSVFYFNPPPPYLILSWRLSSAKENHAGTSWVTWCNYRRGWSRNYLNLEKNTKFCVRYFSCRCKLEHGIYELPIRIGPFLSGHCLMLNHQQQRIYKMQCQHVFIMELFGTSTSRQSSASIKLLLTLICFKFSILS